jgi:hypothetical protein
MEDVVWFAIVFGGFFILRAIAATWVFLYLLPSDNRCPECDELTIRVRSAWWNRLLPWFRTSWCYHCGWEGLLRHQRASPSVETHVESERRQ